MVHPNTVLPIGAVDNRPDYDYVSGVTFHVFELADGAEVHTTVPICVDAPPWSYILGEREHKLLSMRKATHAGGR